MSAKQQLDFEGVTYLPLFDQKRLSVQFLRVFECMQDGRLRTLREIAAITGDPEASISARLRDMKKERFGKHLVFKQRRGDPTKGVWEYQLIARK